MSDTSGDDFVIIPSQNDTGDIQDETASLMRLESDRQQDHPPAVTSLDYFQRPSNLIYAQAEASDHGDPVASVPTPGAALQSFTAPLLVDTSERGCGYQMVHSFRNKEEFAHVHREGSIIEMSNEEATYRRFNDTATHRNAWVIASLPGSHSLLSSDLQTRWIVLVELPQSPEKVFPEEGEDCTLGFKHDFIMNGQPFNPGMLKAQRVPNPFDDFPELTQYSAHAAFSVTVEYMAHPITKQRYHPLASVAITQPQDASRATQLTGWNAVKVVIRVSAQLVTHEAELKALARLMDHKRSLTPLEKRASLAFDYMIDFRRSPPCWVDLFQELPHMHDPSNSSSTPDSLKTIYMQLNEDHRRVYEQLRRIPAGLALILGCPGAGKTALNAFIAAMALSQPIEEEIEGKKRQRRVKILYLLDVNDPCDDAANRVYRTLKDAGIPRRVIRVRGCAREMSRSAKLHAPSKNRGTDGTRQPDFTSGFLRQAQLSRTVHINRRDPSKAPSLDEAAWEKFEEEQHGHKALSKLLEKLRNGAPKTQRTASELRSRVATLYFQVIKNADFIATTPVGASGQLSAEFQPDLVFVDEAAHARELTSLIPLAFSPARAYIFTGDTRQTRPFVSGATMTRSDIMEKGLRDNPYAKQLMISTMERADLAGALSSKLLITHRMHGNLHQLASDLFYDGLLRPGMMTQEALFPKSVQHVQAWLRLLTHSHDCGTPRILINHRGAVEARDRTSFFNPVHEAFVKDRCYELLQNDQFKRVDNPDQPGRILIITPYKAAFQRYRQFTDVMPPHFRGRLNVEQRYGAMEARTVDSAQGHEADFVFVDTVRTETAGFLNDPKRLCVMLTRARIGEMILMHEGMTMRRRRGVLVEAEWTTKVYEHCKMNNQLYHMG